MFIKSIVVGLGLVAGLAFAAQAQTSQVAPTTGSPSVASLPPSTGPRPSSTLSIPAENHAAVTASGAYPGPGPGAGTGHMPPHFEKPADWDQNVQLHPYTSNVGPKPN